MPWTACTSGAFSAGMTTSRMPCSWAEITWDRVPRTGTKRPSRESSPISSTRLTSTGFTCRVAMISATAMDRSKAAPSLRTSAGERFTVTRPVGTRKPLFFSAANTRSRLSRTAASGRPTRLKMGWPPDTKASTVTGIPSTPCRAKQHVRASINFTALLY